MKSNTISRIFAILFGWSLLTLGSTVSAEPAQISIQGKLQNAAGAPLLGTRAYRVRFFNAATAGTQLGGNVTGNVALSSAGRFSIILTPPAQILNQNTVYYELAIDSAAAPDGIVNTIDTFPNRIQVTSVPFARNAGQLGGLAAASYAKTTDLVPYAKTSDLGSSATQIGGGTFWRLGGNAITSGASQFLGTTTDQPFEIHVNGNRVMRLDPDAINWAGNVILGDRLNAVDSGLHGATIAGGGGKFQPNRIVGNFGTIGGGAGNMTTSFATVGGGVDNVANIESGATISGGRFNSASGFSAVVGGGENNAASGSVATIAGGGTNIASGTVAAIGGGNANIAAGFRATVAGGYQNQAVGESSAIGGGESNVTTGTFALIGGGSGNQAKGNHSTIGGGESNLANGQGSTIGGGRDNQAFDGRSTIGGGEENVASGLNSTVSGGRINVASGPQSFVGGGDNNTAQGSLATVAGGQINSAPGPYSTVGGGIDNLAAGSQSTLGGGISNSALGVNSFVGGGASNTASAQSGTVAGGSSNRASGINGSILGGTSNVAAGMWGTVGGGASNVSSGTLATVPGGSDNSAFGTRSFAAGHRAKANHNGTFVWGDSTNADFASTANDQFLIRATGGVGIVNTRDAILRLEADTDNAGGELDNPYIRISQDGDLVNGIFGFTGSSNLDPEQEVSTGTLNNALYLGTKAGSNVPLQLATSRLPRITITNIGRVGIGLNNPGHPLHIGTNATNGNGAHVTAGGMWTNGSDRNSKEALAEIDKQAVLEKVAALPVTQWRYKGEAADVKHFGPMAQDFMEAFGLGESERHIGTVDMDGVALAAIQALYEQLKEDQATIQVQQQRLETVQREQAALRLMVEQLTARADKAGY